jgi:hypothetical protein
MARAITVIAVPVSPPVPTATAFAKAFDSASRAYKF